MSYITYYIVDSKIAFSFTPLSLFKRFVQILNAIVEKIA